MLETWKASKLMPDHLRLEKFKSVSELGASKGKIVVSKKYLAAQLQAALYRRFKKEMNRE